MRKWKTDVLLNDVDRGKDAKNAFSARRGKFSKRGKLHQTDESTNQDERRAFQENVTTVTRKDILRETAQSEIGRVIGLVLLVKAEKFKMLLVVLRNRIFVINFLKRRYLFIIIHVVILVVLII